MIINFILNFIVMLALIISAGKFDAIMDAIKDISGLKAEKFWLWRWVIKHLEYIDWFNGSHPLPFLEKRGYKFEAGSVLYSDAWHQAKHLMLISWTGAISSPFALAVTALLDLNWYWQLLIWILFWWFFYWLEGAVFNEDYDLLKEKTPEV